jgi:pimeloyl-ACP methyl ester carboxylesterase
MLPQTLPFQNKNLQAYSNEKPGLTSIVFLHGNSCSSRLWQKQFDSPLDDNYNLLAYDFMGFGDSDHSDDINDYSITSLKNSVLHFIDQQHLKDYFLVGHSLGGHVIHQLVDQLKGCKGIISMGAPPISVPPDIAAMYLPAAPVGVMFQKDFTDDDLNNVATNFFYAADKEPDFFKADFRKSDGNTRAAIGAILADPAFKDEVVQLTRSPLRKAFFSGKHEESLNNEYYNTFNFPNTWGPKVHLIPDAGHVPQWENPEVVNQLIDEFVRV